MMDFSRVSFDAQWTYSKTEMQEERKKAIIYACLFSFTGTMLLIGIIRTISTNPGNIPDHKEWDMSTDVSDTDEFSGMIEAKPTTTSTDQGAGGE
jgi:hypothetical protein